MTPERKAKEPRTGAASQLRFEKAAVRSTDKGSRGPSWKKTAARVQQTENRAVSEPKQAPTDTTTSEAPPTGNTTPQPTSGQSVPRSGLRQESHRTGAVSDHNVSGGKFRQDSANAQPDTHKENATRLGQSSWKKQAGNAARREAGGQAPPSSKFRQESSQLRPADRLHQDGDIPDEPPKLRRDKHRVERWADKLDKAQGRLSNQKPKKRGPVKRVAYHAGAATHSFVHGKVYEAEQDNVGVEAAHQIELTGETAVRKTYRAVRNHVRTRPARKAQRAQRRYTKAATKFQTDKAMWENPEFSSRNPISKAWRKRQRQKQYAKQAREATRQSAKATGQAVGTAKQIAGRVVYFVRDHPAAVVIALLYILFMLALQSCMTSMTAIGDGLSGSVAATTYPATDADLLGAEAAYAALEAGLQSRLDSYEADHDYDEYQFELDDIEHDPYVLLSILSAFHPEGWTLADVESELQSLFDRQYILTEDVTTETRYRTETRTDDAGNEYEEEVPYTYTICTVKLENFNLSHVPVYIMSEEQLSRYALYMATLGNRPDLFPDSAYVGRYPGFDPGYEIPPEALSDEKFAAMMAEATKYLGYPYVWGGSSPSTSFDCSGFVSWVINNCGCGWNVGRLGATGLYYICTPVSPANAKPGDLIFFQGTYDTDGMSHVGIYVGDGMMIHCGDPIQFASINTSYWQAHFAAFGRLP